MKAIKIDAVNKTVTEVLIDRGIEPIYTALGCQCFTTVRAFESSDVIYCDDEGLFNDPQHFFTIGNYPEPIAGNGLILGTTYSGGSQDCEIDLESVKNDIIFLSRNDVIKSYS